MDGTKEHVKVEDIKNELAADNTMEISPKFEQENFTADIPSDETTNQGAITNGDKHNFLHLPLQKSLASSQFKQQYVNNRKKRNKSPSILMMQG